MLMSRSVDIAPLDDEIARHPGKATGAERRRHHLFTEHTEDVGAGTFAQVAGVLAKIASAASCSAA